jgi:hypothetical protein
MHLAPATLGGHETSSTGLHNPLPIERQASNQEMQNLEEEKQILKITPSRRKINGRYKIMKRLGGDRTSMKK